ncbi:MAG: phosphotransferase [Candidatus Omnitrophica bacterium CG07_land_8_20_14_0_80_42_15]|uniref:Phosphotransferase n=1 Tax=Candidatus Aquitaenariimonas noxiae TaxID=1974741 RepID=A0A2J0KSH3_9BACT|nr:MAG: phosphotransferase [Candidatus Omnitrophica bacterium CG07_land_8_20_14_0_80_42_15]
MLLEIHAHSSKYSKCSQVDPVTLVRQAQDKGVQGIVITEHKYKWSEDEIRELRLKSEVENNFLILSAQEAETDIGHVLVYGVNDVLDKVISIEELRKNFPDAALIWAHPFRNGKVPSEGELKNPLLDAIEIFNVNYNAKENYTGLSLWHRYKFTAVGGSDTHSKESVAIFPTEINHPISTIEELVVEIKKGRCKPFFKEIPKSGSNITVTEITMGIKGSDEFRTRLITKKITDDKRWEQVKNSLKIREEVYKNGFDRGKYRVPKIVDIDEKDKLIIEEGQRGSSLFDVLGYVNDTIGMEYFKITAQWLAKLHNMKLRMSDPDDAIARERKRFTGYEEAFVKTNNPHTKYIKTVIEFLRKKEEQTLLGDKKSFVQCHGDYHPKNVIIGQDRSRDISTLFVSVIDFDSSISLPRAFDVGYFLSQFRYQFHNLQEVLEKYKEEYFIGSYAEASDKLPEDFGEQVKVFKLRANLSIASYLIKVGKGESRDISEIIKELRYSDKLEVSKYEKA